MHNKGEAVRISGLVRYNTTDWSCNYCTSTEVSAHLVTFIHLNLWSRSSTKYYLIIQSVPQTEHITPAFKNQFLNAVEGNSDGKLKNII
jgi:hypothetical protein